MSSPRRQPALPGSILYNFNHMLGSGVDPIRNISMPPADRRRVAASRTKLTGSPSCKSDNYYSHFLSLLEKGGDNSFGLSKLGKTIVALDGSSETFGPGGHRPLAGTKTSRNYAAALKHIFASKTESV